MVKVFMKEGHLWQDITHAVVAEKGIPLRMGFSSLQDSQDVGNITLTLHMDSLEGASLLGMERRAVRVTKDDVPIFEGVTVDDAKVDLKQRSDLVYAQVKCKPYSALFDEVKIDEEIVWTDIPILTSSSDCLIRRLFGLLTDMIVISDTEITKELVFVKLEKGEGVEEYLTEVLYQQGLAYYIDVDVIYIVEPYKDRSLSHSLEIGEILASPKITQAPYIVDERCVVRLPKALVYNSEVVYELNKSRYPDTGEPTEYAVIESGEHYPIDDEGPSLLEAVYATDRETDDIELIHAEGLDIDVHTRRQVGDATEKVYISLSVDSLDSESTTLQLYNDKEYEVSLRNIRILAGTAYYYDWTTVYEDIEILGDDDEVDGIYLADSSQARAFIKRYRAEKNAERTSVEFTTHIEIAPNSLIEIAGLPYQLLVRYRTEEEGYFTYQCVAYQVKEVQTKGRIRVVPREGVRDGTSPIAVVLYALGDMDGPFAEVDEAPVVVADENYLLSDEQYIVGTGSPWTQVPPIPKDDEVVWTITGYYVPPQIFPNKWTAPIRVTGEPAKLIRLFANPSAIQKSARGLYEQTEVEIEASVQGLSGELSWSVSDGDWEYAKDGVEDIPNKIILDATSVEGLSSVVSASIGEFSSSIAISVIIAGGEEAVNMGGVTVVPDHNTLDVGALRKGDYFLWAGDPKPKDDSAVPPYDAMVKGEVYEYSGTRWVKSANGDLVMTLFDSYAELEDDDENVVAFKVIKKLVSINAFIKNLVAENLQAGSGKGTAGSGFRFRAKSDRDGDGTNVPVFDVMFGDTKLFEIDTIAGNIDIGDFEDGNGVRWDNITKKLYVRGHIDADSGTIRGQLDTVTLETVLGGDTEYPKGNFTTNEALLTLLVSEVGANTPLRVSGTINGEGFKSVKYESINTQEVRKYTHSKVLWEDWYKTFSVLVCTVTITFTMNNNSTRTYVLRKIYGNSRTSTNTITYPNYPSPPSGFLDLIGRGNYNVPDPNEGFVPAPVSESDFNSITPLRSFPYNIMSLSVWDSTSERLFIKNLPSSAPSESGRVWNDNGTLKIVT